MCASKKDYVLINANIVTTAFKPACEYNDNDNVDDEDY